VSSSAWPATACAWKATAFHHDYRDQINFQTVDPVTFQGTFVNLGRTRAQGLELAVEAAPRTGVRLFAQYTYLDGVVKVSGDAFNPSTPRGRRCSAGPRTRDR
jgi:outer membrane receptor protein involved in Fe transport